MDTQSGTRGELSELGEVALASALSTDRDVWLGFLELDERLAGTIARMREPMLAQIRLAWWRDALADSTALSSGRDPLLHTIEAGWGDDSASLIDLVNAWEHLLVEAPLPHRSVSDFVESRGEACAGLAVRLDCGNHAANAARAGQLWSLARLAVESEDDQTRSFALAQARPLCDDRITLPKRLRPLVIIAGLSIRSIRNDGIPLIGDRLSPLVALRLGLFGR